MSNLVVDIGNSYRKLAVFEKRKLTYFERTKVLEEDHLDLLIKRFGIQKSIVSSVAEDKGSVFEYLSKQIEVIDFSTENNPGIINEYQSAATLGLDRWAKVIAAFKLYANENLLMIDAGTCITYDVLRSDAVYKGGSISLGIQMRFKALHHYTGRLPLISFDGSEDIPEGTNTPNALKNGVLQGILHEIEGFIRMESERNPGLKVILTGGDSEFLSKQLKNSIFASQIGVDPYLVLRGLNEVIAL